MGRVTFGHDVTLDGCVDHQEGIADDETHAFFTRLMDDVGEPRSDATYGDSTAPPPAPATTTRLVKAVPPTRISVAPPPTAHG